MSAAMDYSFGGASCPLCNFSCHQYANLLSHVQKIHRHSPSISLHCPYPACSDSYNKVNSMRKHLSRKHGGLDLIDLDDSQQNLISPEEDHHMSVGEFSDSDSNAETHDLASFNYGKYIFSLRHQYHLTQAAVSGVIEETHFLLNQQFQCIRSNVLKTLAERGIDNVDDIFEFSDGSPCTNPFEAFANVHTPYMLNKFACEQLNLIEPFSVNFGHKYKWVKGRLKKVACEGCCVDFLSQLKVLLNDSDILYEVDHPHASEEDGVLCDVMDGDYYKQHPIFSADPTALQICAYYDDLEVANALGAKAKKHKVGVFYWMLLNVPPHLRSALRTIQLLGVAKTNHLKAYGKSSQRSLFSNFLQGLKQLERGFEVIVNGETRVFKGALLLFSGDTPASNLMAGFKESVGSAIRPCRNCMCLKTEINEKFFAEQFTDRHITEYRQQCALVDDSELGRKERKHYSKVYGVCSLSVLDEAPYFDATLCFPQDIMHVILEGILNSGTD